MRMRAARARIGTSCLRKEALRHSLRRALRPRSVATRHADELCRTNPCQGADPRNPERRAVGETTNRVRPAKQGGERLTRHSALAPGPCQRVEELQHVRPPGGCLRHPQKPHGSTSSTPEPRAHRMHEQCAIQRRLGWHIAFLLLFRSHYSYVRVCVCGSVFSSAPRREEPQERQPPQVVDVRRRKLQRASQRSGRRATFEYME